MSTLPPKNVHIVHAQIADEKDVGGYYPPLSEDEKKDKKRKRSNATVGLPESPESRESLESLESLESPKKKRGTCFEFKRHEKFKWTTSAGRHELFKADQHPLSISGPHSGYYGNRFFHFYKPRKQADGSWGMLTEFRNTTVNRDSEFTHQLIYLIDVPAKTEEIFNKME